MFNYCGSPSTEVYIALALVRCLVYTLLDIPGICYIWLRAYYNPTILRVPLVSHIYKLTKLLLVKSQFRGCFNA